MLCSAAAGVKDGDMTRLSDVRSVFDAPIFSCGFRPFFVLGAAHGVLAMLLWGLFLLGWSSLPQMPGGPVLWHAHEMLSGFAMAAVAGFLLTALPEFTGEPALCRQRLAVLVGLWIAARLSLPAVPWVGLVPALLLHLGFIALLAWYVIPPLWRDPERRHISFGLALLLMAVTETGFFLDLYHGGAAMRWLYATTGAVMLLIVIALSRISMRIVNDELLALGVRDTEYRARPPRRLVAGFTIALFTCFEFVLPGHPVGGWLALAAGAALLNLLNDWHLGRVLFVPRVLMLYAVYWLMAGGYVLMGLALLGADFTPSVGRHVLLVGGLGFTTLVVMFIAGQSHSGHAWRMQPWFVVAAIALLGAALVRAWGGIVGTLPLQLLAAGLWSFAFLFYLAFSMRMLVGARPDRGRGCDEFTH